MKSLHDLSKKIDYVVALILEYIYSLEWPLSINLQREKYLKNVLLSTNHC